MPIFKGFSDVNIALSKIGVAGGSMSTRGIVDIGHVLEVCLNPTSPLYKSPKDIGKIRYRSSVIVNAYADNELSTVAYPLDRSVARYPFPGELVILFAIDGEPREESEQPIDTTIFYTTVVSALHNVSYNSHPFFIADASTVVPQNTPTLSAEGRFEKLVDDISLVKTAQNKIKIHKQLQPFEGDFILQGRYGNSIRFGATALTTKAPWTDGTTGVSGDPVIAIRVDRQTTDQEKDMFVVEDINNDDTSIYLTTSQPVKLNLASSALLEPWSRSNFNGISTLRTVIGVSGSASNVNDILKVASLQTGKQNSYKGSQLLTNSDRIILNAREDYLMMFGSRGIIMSSPEEIKIDTDLSITLFGGGGVHLGAPNELAIKNANTKAPDAGNYAQPTVDNIYEPLVLGQKLYDLLDDIIDVLTSSEIVTPVGKASFNQDTLYRLKSIKARLPEFKSTTVFIDGVSHDSVLEAPIPPAPEPVVQETGTLVVQPQSFVEVSAGEVVNAGNLTAVTASSALPESPVLTPVPTGSKSTTKSVCDEPYITKNLDKGWVGKKVPFRRTVIDPKIEGPILASKYGKVMAQAILATIKIEQNYKGFNYNLGGFDITSGGWNFNPKLHDGYVVAREGGTKLCKAFISFKSFEAFIEQKINSFTKKGFQNASTAQKYATLWYEKWNGYGVRSKYPNRPVAEVDAEALAGAANAWSAVSQYV